MLIFSRSVVGGQELLGEAEAGGELAVLRPILLVLQRIGVLGVDRRLAADDDEPGAVAVGVQVQADSRMVPDVSDLGGVGFRVDDRRPCRRSRTTPTAARAGRISRPWSASRSDRTRACSETSCVNSTAMDPNVVSRIMTLNLSVDEVLTTTRSVRKRLDLEKPVPREVLMECLELALQAPTGSNAQGWQWVFVDDAGEEEGARRHLPAQRDAVPRRCPSPTYGDIRDEQACPGDDRRRSTSTSTCTRCR